MSETIIEKCLSGKSHAHVFTQDVCAELWARGYTDVHSATKNVEGYSDRLVHYDTLSAIKTTSGDIIENTQDWGTGFAKVPTIPFALVKGHLPLTALNNARVDIYNIEIIDKGEMFACVFRVKDAYFLFARDDESFQMFVAELVELVKTVKEAFESMKPEAVKMIEANSDKEGYEEYRKNWPILRQGDLFFIGNPSAVDNDPPSFPYSYQCAYLRKIGDRGESDPVGGHYHYNDKYWWYPQIKRDGQPSRHGVTRIIETDNQIGIPDIQGVVQQVSGTVKHPQHKQLKLGKSWWVVVPNRVKRSITVENRGGGRGD